jgi:hypothetical protein
MKKIYMGKLPFFTWQVRINWKCWSCSLLNVYGFFILEMCHVDQLAHQTPLYYAARKGHLEMCKFLIEKGCDPNHVDTHKKTPI